MLLDWGFKSLVQSLFAQLITEKNIITANICGLLSKESLLIYSS